VQTRKRNATHFDAGTARALYVRKAQTRRRKATHFDTGKLNGGHVAKLAGIAIVWLRV
jgi:hypothetical protein